MGLTIYNGPSKFDGTPIIGVVTHASSNSKLTDRLHAEVLQLWVLPRDAYPADAMRSGADASVCGTCPLRPWRDGQKVSRTCYVNPMPIGTVWKNASQEVFSAREAVHGSRARLLRLGAWGDPAALPYDLVSELAWEARAAGITRRTGYTHAWRNCDARFRHLVMASCEGTLQALQAQLMGWRTFTVQPRGTAPVTGISCPASDEAGKRTTCEKCGLCDGSTAAGDNRKSIEIWPHGPPNMTRGIVQTVNDIIARDEALARANLEGVKNV
jgi:hypothetical protein